MNQKKKKILFCLRDFNHGGIPSCLLQLLRLFDHERYEVEVYCGDQTGVYGEPFKEFNVLPQDTLMWLLMSNYRKLSGWKKWAAIAVKMARHGLRKLGFDLYDWYIAKTAQKLSRRGVEVAISFAEGFPCHLGSLISVPRRLTWVHCEYDWVSPCEDLKLELTRYSSFDKIVCVSKRTKEAFDNVFPSLSSKTVTVKNVVDVERIKNLSSQDSNLEKEFFDVPIRILSVGRVCWQKQFEVIPQIMKSVSQKIDCKWFIVGGGPDDEVETVTREIIKQGMQERVIMLGPRSNPYAYMRNSDVLVVPSRYESYPTVVNESKIVGTPVVCNDFSSVHEIMDENCGVVTTIDNMANSLIGLLDSTVALKRIKSNIKQFRYDNQPIIEKIYSLIDSDD